MGDMKKLRSDAFDGAGGTSKGERLLAEPILIEALNETRDAANILKFATAASAGGGVSEALVVTGLKATDEVLAITQRVKGGATIGTTPHAVAPVGWSTLIADGITIEWTADPGAGAILDIMIRRVTV